MPEAYAINAVIEERLIIVKLNKRIEAARKIKRELCGMEIPDEIKFDEIVPDTVDLRAKIAQPFRAPKQDRREVKFRNCGTIGISIDKASMCARAVYGSRNFGKFGTFAEAAAVYDAFAQEVEGEDAVTNDPAAVREKDEYLDAMLTAARMPRYGHRRRGREKWAVKIDMNNCGKTQ